MKKRIIAGLTALCLLILCGGCAKTDEPSKDAWKAELVPSGFTIGTPYAEMLYEYEDASDLIESAEDECYVFEEEPLKSDAIRAFYGIPVMSSGGEFSSIHGFDDNFELSHVVIETNYAHEGEAEAVFNKVIQFYNDTIDRNANVTEEESQLTARWRRDDIEVAVRLYKTFEQYGLVIIVADAA